MKKKLKATLSMFLCAVMVLCSVAVGGMFANADTNTSKTIQLVKDGAAANISGRQASNLYFGKYKQSKNEDGTYNTDPIKWRVHANNTSSKQLFLLSDQGLDTVQYHTKSEDVTWEKSTIRSWLNETFYKAAFNSSEQEMIKSTAVTADVNPKYNTDPGNDTKDKVFLLSINEVNKYFSSYEARMCVPTDYAIAQGADTDSYYTVDGKATCWWWLRSPGYYSNYAAYVRSDSDVYYFGHSVLYDSYCVRPAFNLNLESVIFTSAAVGGKKTSATGTISKIADYSGNDWKVTLKDSNRNFDITDKTAKTGKPGETITLSYTGATIYNKDSTPNEYISVIITDSNGNAIYYGRVAQPTSTNGKVDIKIPSDLTNGEYTLNVFSEQYNGGANDDTKLTDYASEFSTIKLTVCDHTDNTNKATCTEPCLCSICTKELSPATGHAYANPVFAWAEDNTAKVTFTCSNDKTHTLTKDCNITSETTKKATCTEKGEITYTASYTLDNKEYKDEKKVPTDATGHSFDANGKCTKAECGYVCDHAESTDKPTCEKSAVCSECGATLPATGHTYSEWKTTKSATFFKDGVETRSCINEGCTETETRVVLSKFSEFKSGLFGTDFLKAILTVFADLLTSVC